MFTPARYVVIDDEEDELQPLVRALHQLGAPAIGLHYDPPPLPDPALFTGVRVVFSDLHLTKGAAQDQHHFDVIAQLLDLCIRENHGPYVLVVWTSHEQKLPALIARLGQQLSAAKLPLTVLGLDKNKYRNGKIWTGADALRADVAKQVATNLQLRALLSWEHDVLTAAHATLGLVAQLVPEASRTLNEYPAALDAVLSALAVAAAGDTHARANPREAMNGALAPLLMDRIVNQQPDVEKAQLWHAAVSFQQEKPKLGTQEAARINRMLHLAFPAAEAMTATDWGAVIEIPADRQEDEPMKALFGKTKAELLEQDFRLPPDKQGEVRLLLIRGGATCDHAQCKTGPIPFILAALLPASVKQKDKVAAPEYETPPFELTEGAAPHRLIAHARFVISLLPTALEGWEGPIFRVREQLLMAILSHTAGHVVRPGLLRF